MKTLTTIIISIKGFFKTEYHDLTSVIYGDGIEILLNSNDM